MRLISFNHYWRNILTLKMLLRATETYIYKAFCFINELKRCITWLMAKPSPVVPFSSVQFCHSVVSDSLQPHGLRSTSGFPVHHQLPEFTQTHVHCVSDAIQPPHPLPSPSPPAFNLSQHQGLFQWVSSLHLRIGWQKYWSCPIRLTY